MDGGPTKKKAMPGGGQGVVGLALVALAAVLFFVRRWPPVVALIEPETPLTFLIVAGGWTCLAAGSWLLARAIFGDPEDEITKR